MRNRLLVLLLSLTMTVTGMTPVLAAEKPVDSEQPANADAEQQSELNEELERIDESSEEAARSDSAQQADRVDTADEEAVEVQSSSSFSGVKKVIGGLQKLVEGVTYLEDMNDEVITLSDGTYYINENSFPDNGRANWEPDIKPLVVESGADVEIIIKDGMNIGVNLGEAQMNHCAGIFVPEDSSLTLTPGNDADKEVKGTGIIYANGTDHSAGIGGCDASKYDSPSCGTITINGLTVHAWGGLASAGIGGTVKGSGGNITINGGTVYAEAGVSDLGEKVGAAGIGAGPNVNTVAKSEGWCDVDGDNYEKGGHHITINGGTVYAVSIGGGAGIGGGYSSAGHAIRINGGTVKAIGSGGGAGIGGGRFARGYNIEIAGGDVVAVGAEGDEDMNNAWKFLGAGIGGGSEHEGYGISIKGGNVLAISGVNFEDQEKTCWYYEENTSKYYKLKADGKGAGIGGGCGNSNGAGKYISIKGKGTEVTSIACKGAGIGGAFNSNGTDISIENGAKVHAYTDMAHVWAPDGTSNTKAQGAAIGGGGEAKGFDIEIKDSWVEAIANAAAGIGCGYSVNITSKKRNVTVCCTSGKELYVHAKSVWEAAIGSGKGPGDNYGKNILRTDSNSTINTYTTYKNGVYGGQLAEDGSDEVKNAHAYTELWLLNAKEVVRTAELGRQSTIPTVGYKEDCEYDLTLENIDLDSAKTTFNWYTDANKTAKADAPENAGCSINSEGRACISIEPDKDAKDYNIVPAGTYYFSVNAVDKYSGKTIESNVQTFTVNRQNVDIKSGSASKYYDGKPLTAEKIIQDEVVIMSTEDASGNTIEVKDTIVEKGYNFNSITDRGTVMNSFSYSVKSKYNADNYNITATRGILTVYRNELSAEITGYSGKYDGGAHSPEITVCDKNGNVLTVADGLKIEYSTSPAGEEGSWEKFTATTENPVPSLKNAGILYVKAEVNFENASGSKEAVTDACKLEIRQRDIRLTSESKTREYDGTALTAEAVKVTGDGFVSGEGFGGNGPAASGTVTRVGSVKNTISCELKENTTASNYNIAKSEGTLKVTRKAAPITIATASAEKKYDGTELKDGTVTYTKGILCEGDALTVDVDGSATYAGTEKNTIAGYKVTNNSGEDVTDCYTFAEPALGELTVYPRKLTVTSGTGTGIKNDGDTSFSLKKETYTIGGDGFAEGDAGDNNLQKYLKVENFTEVKEVTAEPVDNEFDCYFDIDEIDKQQDESIRDALRDRAASYEIEKVYGQLFAAGELMVYGQDYKGEYDGKAHGDAATVIGGAGDIKLTYSTSTDGIDYTDFTPTEDKPVPAITNAGTLYVKAEAESGSGIQTKAAYYTLTVEPREITVATASGSKQYDGTALTNDSWSIVEGSMAGEEKITVKANGSQTAAGESENSFDVEFNGNAESHNYNVTKKPGTLTVTQNLSPIKITTGSGRQKYTGYALTDPSYTVNASMYNETEKTLFNGDRLEVVTDGTITNAGSADNSVRSIRVLSSEGRDVTSSYTIAEPTLGTLRVLPRTITIRTASAQKLYDGTALTRNGSGDYTVLGESFIGNDGMTVDITGTRTKAGSSDNTAEYEFKEGTNPDNYNVSVDAGTLTVNKRNVILTSGSGIWQIDDGKTHSNTNITVSGDGFAAGEVTVGENGILDDSADNGIVCSGFKELTKVTTGAEPYAEPYYVDNSFDYAFNNVDSGNYEITRKYGRLVVYDQTIPGAVNGPEDYAGVYDGKPHGGTLYELGEGITRTFEVSEEKGGTYSPTGNGGRDIPTRTKAGTTYVKVTATQGGNTATADYKIQITKRPITVQAGSATKVYDGKPLTCQDYSITSGSLADGEELSEVDMTSESEIRNAGSQENVLNTIRISDSTKETETTDNYNITKENGKLTVTKRPVVLASASLGIDESIEYDGKPHAAETVTEIGKASSGMGFIEGEGAEYSGWRTFVNAGIYSNSFDYAAAGATELGNYNISIQFGQIQIEKRNVTLTSGTGVYRYNNKVHTNEEVAVGGSRFAEGEADVDAQGILKNTESNGIYCSNFTRVKAVTTSDEQKFVDNEFSYEFTDSPTYGAKAENYNITQIYGKLAVYNGDESGLISPDSYQGTYDGEEHYGTLTDLGEGVTRTFEIMDSNDAEFTPVSCDEDKGPARRDAGTTIVRVTAQKQLSGASEQAATAQSETVEAESAVEGTAYYAITILPRTVTLTSDSATKRYDGKALSNTAVAVGGDGFVEGEGAEYSGFAAITNVGEIDNTFDYTLKSGTRAENYTISQSYGKLTVQKALAAIVTGIATGDSSRLLLCLGILALALLTMISVLRARGKQRER